RYATVTGVQTCALPIWRRRRESGARPRAGAGADEGSRRPDENPRVLRRREAARAGGAGGVGEAAVQREEVPQGLRHPEAIRRERSEERRVGKEWRAREG